MYSQILKLCANHCLSADMKLTPMPSSDRAWCYTAMDYSEEEMKLEQLAAKFKNADKAEAFKNCFIKCCQQLKDAESKSPASAPVKPQGKKELLEPPCTLLRLGSIMQVEAANVDFVDVSCPEFSWLVNRCDCHMDGEKAQLETNCN